MLFKTDYFDETPKTDDTTGDTKETWRYDYEARFPSDEWVNYQKLQEFQSFVYSTYRAEATGNALPGPVTYEGVTYTTDTADYRLAKFKAEFGNYAQINSFIFYYIFTELFLMVDSRAKNLFIGFSGSETDPEKVHVIDRKAIAEPYDMDTSLGINNQGSLVFGYSLEDTDYLEGGANIFNGQDSVLWNNLRDAFYIDIQRMYGDLRSTGILSYDSVETRFENHQAKWPEAVWVEDAQFKYIDPLVNPDPDKEPDASYLKMLQGSKEGQRKWWLSNRFKYMDSKWNAGDAVSRDIIIRGYAKSDITVTPYSDIYPAIVYGSYSVKERGKQGQPTLLRCPLDNVNDTEIHIHSAPQIASVGDLSGLKVGFANFSAATKLISIKLGDADPEYENPNLNDLRLSSNRLLSKIDLRNCTALGTGDTKSLDLSGCPNLEQVYLDGTQLTGLTLPNGGVLDKLHIPNSISILSIMNQSVLSEFKVSYTDMFDGDGVTESFELAQTPQTISYARVYKMDEFTGDGSATSFRLSYAPQDNELLKVFIVSSDGQQPIYPSYGVNGQTLTTSAPIKSGYKLQVTYIVPIEYTSSGNTITFESAPGIGTTIRVVSTGNIPTKLLRLRVENGSTAIDTKAFMMSMEDNLPIRLIGVNWTSANETETLAIFNKLQRMKGMDASASSTDLPKAVISGVLSMDTIGNINCSDTFAGIAEQQEFEVKYPIVTTEAGNITVTVGGVKTSQFHVLGKTVSLDTPLESDATVQIDYVASLYDAFTAEYPDLYLRVGGVIKFKCRYYAENGNEPLPCGVDEFGRSIYEIIVNEGDDAPDPIQVAHAESFTGDGETLRFQLESTPVTIDSVSSGGKQMVQGEDYTIDNNYVEFTVAPENGDYVLVKYYTGYIPVPTKQSTPQYTYTYIGWDQEDNNTLKNIHGNMSFRQTFDRTVNQYTVSFYNDDMSWLYDTIVPYGGEAVYKGLPNPPRKTNVPDPENWKFTGWNVDISSITGQTVAVATFASPIIDEQIQDDWDQIIRNANNRYTESFTGDGSSKKLILQYTPESILSVTVGDVATKDYEVNLNVITLNTAPAANIPIVVRYRTKVTYEVGNYKDLTLTDGTVLTMQVVGINTDQLATGEDTAQYSWISKNLYPTGHAFNEAYHEGVGKYVYDEAADAWVSNIWGKHLYNAIGDWDITVAGSGILTLRYMISSETIHDYGYIYVDDTVVADRISGEGTWIEKAIPVTNGQVVHIRATYHKDVNQNAGTDSLYLRFIPSDGITISTTFTGTEAIPSHGAIGGFDGMDIYPYLQTDIKNLLPENVRNAVKPVKKYTKSAISDGETITIQTNRVSTPTIWIPSMRELGFISSMYETEGPSYNAVYYDNDSRKKSITGSEGSNYYWARSHNSDEAIGVIDSLGSSTGYGTANVLNFPVGYSI